MSEIVSGAQREMIDRMRRPRRSLVGLLSGQFPVGGVVADLTPRERELVADHLEESARRALAPAIRLDACFFSMTMEEAEFSTPAVDQLRAVAAAVRDGDAKVPTVAGLDVPQKYGVSALLEAARNRAQAEGAPGKVAETAAKLWAAWDSWAGVSGSPAERSWYLAGRPRGEIVHD